METLMNAIVKAEYLKHPDEQVKLHMKMKFCMCNSLHGPREVS
ncbi:hypothetical protein HanIR_Chr17g0861981 [Helianthus annuus]|nr:hypothetical protein HanIR_Chr17g0861981 [Helianthus annuus]